MAGPRVLRALAIALVSLLICGLLATMTITPSHMPPMLRPLASSLSGQVRGAVRFVKSLNMQPKLKVVVSFYQVVAIRLGILLLTAHDCAHDCSIPLMTTNDHLRQVVTILESSFSISIPASYTRWMKVFRFVGVDWSALVLPDGCITRGHTGIMLMNALAPILLVLFVFFLSTLRACVSLPRGSCAIARAVGGAVTNGLLGGAPFALVVSFAFVPSVSARIFASWSCEGYGDVDAITIISSPLDQMANLTNLTNITSGASESPRTTYYLRRDLVRALQEWHVRPWYGRHTQVYVIWGECRCAM